MGILNILKYLPDEINSISLSMDSFGDLICFMKLFGSSIPLKTV
jgi:hypothetical protein